MNGTSTRVGMLDASADRSQLESRPREAYLGCSSVIDEPINLTWMGRFDK